MVMNLKTQLFNAFAPRPRPPATRIVRPIVSDYESKNLRDLLSTKTPAELTDFELRTVVEGNLWMLTPEAFLYFLPGFLHASLVSYETISVFASEIIGVLTKPSRADIVDGLDRIAQAHSELGFSEDMVELLRKQQLEWFDSGTPTANFQERFNNLTGAEGAAIFAFLVAFRNAYGADFPLGDLEMAIDRYWVHYSD